MHRSISQNLIRSPTTPTAHTHTVSLTQIALIRWMGEGDLLTFLSCNVILYYKAK